MMWDTQVKQTSLPNKPDLVLTVKPKKMCLLINVAMPSDYNITQREAEIGSNTNTYK